MSPALARAAACRVAAVELLRRAQEILEAECDCAAIPGDGLCANCGMQMELERDIKRLGRGAAG